MPEEFALPLLTFLAWWCAVFGAYVIVIFSADALISKLKRRRAVHRYLADQQAALDLEVAAALRHLTTAFSQAQNQMRIATAAEVRSRPATTKPIQRRCEFHNTRCIAKTVATKGDVTPGGHCPTAHPPARRVARSDD